MDALTRLRTPRAGAIAAALLVTGLVLAGCTNPFKPATPEPPDQSGLVADYSTPAKLLSTLQAAMQTKGPAGALAWVDAMASPSGPFAPGFRAVHDPRVLDKWKLSSPVAPPEPWDYDLEKAFYNNFTSRVYPSYDFVMLFDRDDNSVDDEIDEAAGTATLHRFYYIAAALQDGAKIVAIGFVDLSLVKDQGRWYVLEWKDRVDPTIGVDPSDEDNVTLGWRRLENR